MPVNCWSLDEVGAFLASLLPSHAVLKLLAREDAAQLKSSTAVMIEVREGAILIFSYGPWNYIGEVVLFSVRMISMIFTSMLIYNLSCPLDVHFPGLPDSVIL